MPNDWKNQGDSGIHELSFELTPFVYSDNGFVQSNKQESRQTMPPVLPTYARAPVEFVRGKGTWLYDRKGERYLDMGAGIAVNIVGHAHPTLVHALRTQADNLWHTSNLYEIPIQTELASRLVERTFADTVFFTNSGTEAMECCVKMARRHFAARGLSERKTIITFNESFHGRSMGMISAAGGKKLIDGFSPLLPGFVQVPFGNPDVVEAVIDETTAAIMVEPIQGESGVIPAPPGFLHALRQLCDRYGLLLVLDEIQCGMGRTGKLFAHELEDVEPDIVGIAKGIGGGFPLGACLATKEAATGMTVGTHGSTFGGNPLACAVGRAVIEIVTAPGFLSKVAERARTLRTRLGILVHDHPDVFESVRGTGLMLGLVCKAPNLDLISFGIEARVITVPGGNNVMRVLPPLNISEDEIDEAIVRLDRSARMMESRL